MKFKKKPVIIDAVQLRWDTWSEMCEHADVGGLQNGKPEGGFVNIDGSFTDTPKTDNAKMGLAIPTLEGLMIESENDWIIRGVKGELYPCKPDIFEATYERVES